MYSKDRILILDADGTTIDAFGAIERTFAIHHMDIGDLKRFQKRRHLFKYLGGLKEFPSNLKRQLGKQKRARLIGTLTQVYREEAQLYEHIGPWINQLIAQQGLRVGMITRNITNEPIATLERLLQRHGVDVKHLDFLVHVPLKRDKTGAFQQTRADFNINPARALNQLMFDWRALKRWNISEDRLPPGSIVRFKTPSIWDLYRWYIISAIFAGYDSKRADLFSVETTGAAPPGSNRT